MQPTPSTRLRAALAGVAIVGSLSAQQFTNGSFENWDSPTSCSVNSTPDDWQKLLAAGLNAGLGVDEGTPSVCAHTIPATVQDGVTYVRAYAPPTGGEGVQQVVAGFVPGNTYTIRYHYAGSNVYGGVGDGYWQVSVDGATVDQSPVFSSLQTTWTARTCTFVATATSHQIGFLGYASQPATASLGLDAVEILGTAQAYGQPCSVGSPLSLAAAGPRIGSNWDLTGAGIEPVSALAVFWFGDSPRVPPIDLAVIGANGCFAHHNANLGAFVATASLGSASYAVAVPANTALVGVELFVQMSAASTATPVGFTTSNGVVGVIGS
ncbi:MAG: hypothetical protein ACE37K_25355 [Planctomycetota bacterium]